MKISYRELGHLARLATPLFIAQVTQLLMYFSDIVMSGRVSPTDMASIAVAQSIWAPFTLALQGLLMAVTPVVAKHIGGKKFQEIIPTVHQGFYLAIICTVLGIILFPLVPVVFDNMTMDSALRTMSVDYLSYVMFGLPALLLFLVLRAFAEGLSFTKATMIVSFIGIGLNVPLNYIFIYGKFGVEAMGGPGCGVATSLVTWGMMIGMAVYLRRKKPTADYNFLTNWQGWNKAVNQDLMKIGLPMAFATLFEVTLFAIIPLLLAPLGVTVVAGHQAAASFSGLLFMLPLSLSMATTIHIGFLWGKQDYQRLKQTAHTALFFALLCAFFLAAFTWVFRVPIAQIYTNDAEVITLAASILVFAAIYQFSDAIQVVTTGVLRGIKDTKPIFFITFIAYWPIGLFVGWLLAMTDTFGPPQGAAGFWIGIIFGLTTAAVLLGWRLKRTLGKIMAAQQELVSKTTSKD